MESVIHERNVMMRGSLDRPKRKSAKENLDRTQTKKAGEALDSSHSQQAKPNHGKESVQRSDTNMGTIFPSNMPSPDKAKSNSTKRSFERMKFKSIRGSLSRAQSRVEPTYSKEKVQESNTIMDVISLPTVLSLDKAQSKSATGSFERVKLKPIRGNLNTAQSKVKPTYVKEKMQESNTNMDVMALPDMLRFLDEEETLLTQLQSKMSDELSRLQVEEHIFLHTLKILSQKHASSNKVNDNQQQSSSGDQELIDALNEALTENGDSVPGNLYKGK